MPRLSFARGCVSPDDAMQRGKTRTAPLTTEKEGADRIRDESGTYVARYRDGDGIVVEVSTGCRERTAAQRPVANVERQTETVRAGLLMPAEARISERTQERDTLLKHQSDLQACDERLRHYTGINTNSIWTTA